MIDLPEMPDDELAAMQRELDALMIRHVKRLRLADRRFNHVLTKSLAVDDEVERRANPETPT